jgi:hypothetical protein
MRMRQGKPRFGGAKISDAQGIVPAAEESARKGTAT